MQQLVKFVIFLVIIFLSVAADNKPVHILMAGDSTMADKVLFKPYTDSAANQTINIPFLERGWGQALPELVRPEVEVLNFAKNGRSTKTFISEGLWDELISKAEKGDFIVIQFGHNDSSIAKKDRYTNPTQFRLNFIAFVSEAKSRGAIPVLCTPVARRKFDVNGVLLPTHGEYPDIIRDVAKTQNVTLIDMEKLTSEWLQREGVDNSKRFFHKYAPGENPLYPNGLDDNTHFNELGAKIVAQFFVNEMKSKSIKGANRILNK